MVAVSFARITAGLKPMNLPIPSTVAEAMPRIYYVHPLLMRGLGEWRATAAHAAALGFDTILCAPPFKRADRASVFVTADYSQPDPSLGLDGSTSEWLSTLTNTAKSEGAQLMLDIVIDRPPADPEHYHPVDPRIASFDAGALIGTQLDDDGVDRWAARIGMMLSNGVNGFRCLGLDRVDPERWKTLISKTRSVHPGATFLAWTPGTPYERRMEMSGAGFDACFSSLAWWDCRAAWFIEEYNLQLPFGPQIGFPEPPFATRVAHGTDGHEVLKRRSLRALQLADRFGSGLMVPMGFEFGASMPLDPTHGDGAGLDRLRRTAPFQLTEEIRELNTAASKRRPLPVAPLRLVASAGRKAAAILQREGDKDRADRYHVTIVNKDLRNFTPVPAQAINAALSGYAPPYADRDAFIKKLYPAETRSVDVVPTAPIELKRVIGSEDKAVEAPRIAIEDVTPSVDSGRFPAKRIVGEIVRVEADIFADGHDVIASSLAWRPADEDDWQEVPMVLASNDRWAAEFVLSRLGRHEFAIRAWKNPFAIFRYELGKKSEAGLDLKLELEEGRALVRAALDSAETDLRSDLLSLSKLLDASSPKTALGLLLDPETASLMAAADKRPFLVQSQSYPIDAERKAAAFASWYQIFPRSQSGDPNRHGTFRDVIGRLPAIRAMGFDVLYFPPIHPIGSTNRKGRNNSLTAGAEDPGSPYAIGSEEGGHDAIHPDLGTFADFQALVEKARDYGLEIALDLAIQASPDHPWLRQHPGWFDWRPDGSIRYAENPPKKYEDIVNVDFYTDDAKPGLWIELRDIVQKWVDNGVKLFRVDNPHTKPLPFWEWLIRDIRARHPETVFLSEAFTRPKVMYRLAKVGFSQSYTYFTWRNEKWELEQYMNELTTTNARNFFRPHFFVNTHDINPDFLQNAPRPAFVIRAALAATLSGLWGVYNGFELCEGRPDVKRKEYADSEKYEIRAWDYDRPGNIISEISMLNRIRQDNPALHSHLGLTLLATTNDKIMFYEKADAGRDNVLLIAVCLDPINAQRGDIEIPLWLWNKNDDGTLYAEDMVDGHRFTMRGKWQPLHLDPGAMPFAIWRISGEA
jgi:starch synthase (maltosyl-transferring)